MWNLLTNSLKCSLRRHKLISINRFYSETKTSNGHFDVIIVGGGGAGLSLAGAICKRNYKNYFKAQLLIKIIPLLSKQFISMR